MLIKLRLGIMCGGEYFFNLVWEGFWGVLNGSSLGRGWYGIY